MGLSYRDKVPQDLRRIIGLVLAIVVVIVLAALAGADMGGNSTRSPEDVRTEQCERSWQNSAAKEMGGSKTRFMEGCIADLKALEGATR